jgi:hypothetical protein
MLRRWFDRRQYDERNPMIRSRAFVYVRLSKIANWRLPPGFFREGFFLGVTLVGCGVKLVFWIAREACDSKRPVFGIPRSRNTKDLLAYQKLMIMV